MPGYDGTGPEGKGSRTGRGLGNCKTVDAPKTTSAPYRPGRANRDKRPRGRGRRARRR